MSKRPIWIHCLLEVRATRDRQVIFSDGSWGSIRVPPGPSWRLLVDGEKRTVWVRRKPAAWGSVPRKQGGWLR
jgi:hypothetical protein